MGRKGLDLTWHNLHEVPVVVMEITELVELDLDLKLFTIV